MLFIEIFQLLPNTGESSSIKFKVLSAVWVNKNTLPPPLLSVILKNILNLRLIINQ